MTRYENEYNYIIDCADYSSTLYRVFMNETYSKQIRVYTLQHREACNSKG